MTRHVFPCIVCGNLTVSVPGNHEICPVCGWQDDGGDYRDPDRYVGGPNHVTLREARENYRAFGASERRRIDRVRPPLPEEAAAPEAEVVGQAVGWLDFVDNPEAVRTVFGARSVPELEGVLVREVVWRVEDGVPELLVRFDLPAEDGYDAVQVQLRLAGAATALEAAHDSDPVGRITLGPGARTPVALSLEAGRFRARVNADRVSVHEVTARRPD
ncbi:CPCC family cysteine-rich protein [Streptomyces sp. NPDC049949]|uniref:CPCC family cysteine-rich protein n=1 Tax=Streptomyces sp. NPDC049949 TaxID=3154627 RepID=UPI0034231965